MTEDEAKQKMCPHFASAALVSDDTDRLQAAVNSESGEIPEKDPNEFECSICNGPFNLEAEGGQRGAIGIIPVAFCPTCLNGVREMAEILWDLVPASWVEEYTEEGQEALEDG